MVPACKACLGCPPAPGLARELGPSPSRRRAGRHARDPALLLQYLKEPWGLAVGKSINASKYH